MTHRCSLIRSPELNSKTEPLAQRAAHGGRYTVQRGRSASESTKGESDESDTNEKHGAGGAGRGRLRRRSGAGRLGRGAQSSDLLHGAGLRHRLAGGGYLAQIGKKQDRGAGLQGQLQGTGEKGRHAVAGVDGGAAGSGHPQRFRPGRGMSVLHRQRGPFRTGKHGGNGRSVPGLREKMLDALHQTGDQGKGTEART